MSIGEKSGRAIKIWIVAATLLVAPRLAKPAAAHGGNEALTESWQDQDAQDRGQEARDREQEKRDREEEARDRAQEKRDREQERAERLDELYSDGREALDEDRFDKAAEKFSQLAELNGPQTDAALYWKAYAENKLGKRDSALTTIADLKKRFAQSRWLKDAGALEIEVKQSTGQPAHPESQPDEELKMLAIQGLMNSDPQRAMPLLEKVLNGSGTPKEKSKALFVLAQNGSPQSREILGRIARGESNPDLQRKAVEYLGLFGGQQSRQTLADIYSSTNDPSIKRAILRSYMIGGDKERLLAAAKGEKDASLRADAIRQLGLVHAPSELRQLYQTETSADVKKDILQAFFLSGDSKFLAEAAQGEKDPEIRRAAIHNLGLIGSEDARQALPMLYAKETDRDNKMTVLNALFIQGNAHALVAIARGEKDPELKKTAVSKLSLMNSKEGNDFLMEILQK
ncbi:MAG TPA: HEAT repeat domain-containing protein [Candidatus Acidoferrum sp.]|jgi:HEAT repeat protein|nr:HEAT repeat domain-containing protein [Candidatus Acidoferrum sp.]